MRYCIILNTRMGSRNKKTHFNQEVIMKNTSNRNQKDTHLNHPPNGRSIRARCFEAFDQGDRPVEITRETGFKHNTVYTYWHQWKQDHQVSAPQHDTPAPETPWDPGVSIIAILRDYAAYTGIPLKKAVHQFIEILTDKQEIHERPTIDQSRRQRKRAARILHEIMEAIIFCWVMGWPPEIALENLRQRGLDCSRFKLQTEIQPPLNE